MGIKMGPCYANLFLGSIKKPFFTDFEDTSNLDFNYYCYINEFLAQQFGAEKNLTNLITSTSANSFNPAFKYTWEVSEPSVGFLYSKVCFRRQQTVY